MRLPTRCCVLSLLAVLCAGAAPAYGAKVYKWVDAQGDVHYGQNAPPGERATLVPTRRSHISDEEARDRLEALTAPTRAGEPPGEHAAPERVAREHGARRAQNCANARRNLRILEGPAPVQARGDDGQPFYLGAEAQEAKLAQTKVQIRDFCD